MPINIPKFFQKAFAQNGGRQDVPITGDTSGGRASYDTGFPPLTRTPIIAGGIPPFGTDFNGVLYDLSMAIQYLQSGVSFPFDQDFADAIGGYSEKAIVADPADNRILWQNNSPNNTLTPSVPNGWTQVFSAAELVRDPTESLRGAPLLASQTQAETGTNNTAMMTALRVFQAIRSTAANASETLRGALRIGTQVEVDAGTADDIAVTPKKLRSGITSSFGAIGYIFLPTWLGGYGIQWGFVDASPGSVTAQTITFPTTFPTACYAVISNFKFASDIGSFGGAYITINQLLTGSVRYISTMGRYWVAIGK